METKELFLINTPNETLRFSEEKYKNGNSEVYLDAVTADGYELNLTLSDKDKKEIINFLKNSTTDVF